MLDFLEFSNKERKILSGSVKVIVASLSITFIFTLLTNIK